MTVSEALYIGGKWVSGRGHRFSSHNPATGDSVWEGNSANGTDVERAVKAAQQAASEWMQTSLDKRIEHLNAFRDLLNLEKNRLADVISLETGKPFWESLTEVSSMANKVSVSIEAYHTRCPEVRKAISQKSVSITRHKPHGVIAVLGPFNFPGHLPNGHIVPALLAGNTVIFKPSEYAPLVAQETMKIWERAQLPPGVINLVQGGSITGKFLAGDSGINGLFFTGSYQTGKFLLEQFAKTPEKILALEMGGNNPLVVTHITDLKAAALLTIQSAFLTAGQRCSCARRLIVPEGKIGDAFIETLIDLIRQIKVGCYTDRPEPFMGPLINETALVRALSAQGSLMGKGALGLVEAVVLKDKGFFISPGLIDVTHAKNRPDEEIFAPLLQLIRVKNFERAIYEANNTTYGLTAGLISEDEEEFRLFYGQVKAGIINWNTPTTGASSSLPFGGIGRSGNHRPSAFYAADYCSYPVASSETENPLMPQNPIPGLEV